jgi:hypothetical protein
MLTWSLPIRKAMLLDHAVTNQLPQLVFHHGRGGQIFSATLMATKS